MTGSVAEVDPIADGVEPVVAVVDLADAQARAGAEGVGDGLSWSRGASFIDRAGARGQSAPGGCARPGSRSTSVYRPSRRDVPGSLHSMRGRTANPAGRPRTPLMKAWGDLPGDDPERDRAETEAAIEAAGIDLDPVPPGHHRHGDETHPSDHAHPHQPRRARASRRSSGSSGRARSAPPSASP